MLKKIISGGQTGVDRAGLDAAIKFGLDHGGSIPKGRRTEDGVLPDIYKLEEMATQSYPLRTEKNVIDGDATLLISHGPLTGGSLLTKEKAVLHARPCLHIDLERLELEKALGALDDFIKANNVEILNVAGPRASGDPRAYSAAYLLLCSFLQNALGTINF